jgi:hypothetical protein
MPAPQNLKNHARFDPMFHFFLLPILLLNIIFSIYIAIHHWPQDPHLHLWWIVMSLAFFVLAGVARASAVRAQNRIIRLEERLRLMALLPAEDHKYIPELTTGQLIALRFACDEELPDLVRKTLSQRLEPKAIKQNIATWRADHERV